jgi:hypothetical protein
MQCVSAPMTLLGGGGLFGQKETPYRNNARRAKKFNRKERNFKENKSTQKNSHVASDRNNRFEIRRIEISDQARM